MTTTEFKQVYWKYYLILERDVRAVEPYVSFHPDNYECFSTEFIKLYQAICSEIDVICKNYCKFIETITGVIGEYKQIKDYAKYILTYHPEIANDKVDSELGELKPWEEWRVDSNDHRHGHENNTPQWWSKYNAVKHDRSGIDDTGKYNYKHATLHNVLKSLAGLYVLERYFYADLARMEAQPLAKVPPTDVTPRSKIFCLTSLDSILHLLDERGLGGF